VKQILAMAVCVGLVGCASNTPPIPAGSTSNSQSMVPVAVDCRYATRMSAELEYIIANPAVPSAIWDRTLQWVGGIENTTQRRSSAKTVLWSIRTNCPGF
jgi:hypothetical protein